MLHQAHLLQRTETPCDSTAGIHTVHSSLHGSTLPRRQPKPDMRRQLHQSRPLLRYGQHPHRSTRQIQGPPGTVICLMNHCYCCQGILCYSFADLPLAPLHPSLERLLQVVEENKRQLCIRQQAETIHQAWLWWTYVQLFTQNCR